MKKESLWVVTQERAEALRGPLKWLAENYNGPQATQERRNAKSILSKIRFEGKDKQVLLTKWEKRTLFDVMQAFPDAVKPARQTMMDLDRPSRTRPTPITRRDVLEKITRSTVKHSLESEPVYTGKGKPSVWIVTQERAESLKGPLKWVQDEYEGPHADKEKKNAKSLLRKIRFEGKAKQVVITPAEKKTLYTVMEAFPDVVRPASQPSLPLEPLKVSRDSDLWDKPGKATVRYKSDEELTPEERKEREEFRLKTQKKADLRIETDPGYMQAAERERYKRISTDAT